MDVVVERCAGLDVHRDSVVATVRLPGNGKSRRRREQQTRSFGSTIGQLETLADWLEGFGVTLVGMEAIGVYWKPVFYVLERRFECWLLNAQHLHNVPGRKSDVIDSAWCCQLLEHGLVRPSFVPPPEIRRLRDLTRLCVAQVEERTRAIQRLEKVLQDAGIKLGSGRVGGRRLAPRGVGRLARWFPPAPHRTVREVLPHTAHRRLSPPAFGFTPATAGSAAARRRVRRG